MKSKIHEYENKYLLMSKTILKTTFVALLLISFSCSKDDSPEQEQQQVIPPATVTNMSPLSGPKTTIVTFTGTNFGADTNVVQVFFDDIEATVQSVTDTQIKTIVPPRAFAGEVSLIINGTAFNNFNFEYLIVDIEVSTFAGGEEGFVDSNSSNAQFSGPFGADLDASGNLYIADTFNARIRKITPNGEVTTLAGSGVQGSADGSGVNATFSAPVDVAVDQLGNVYVADLGNNRIRKITPEGIVSTLAGSTPGFADGTGSNAMFTQPFGITVDNEGVVYVADTGNSKIRKVTPEGIVTTIAGSTAGFADGSPTNAQFSSPFGIAINASGDIYVADSGNDKIRLISTNGNVTTIAGTTEGFADGNVNTAQFSQPLDVTLDALGNVYVIDEANDKIRKIKTSGEVITVAGSTDGFTDGTGANAQFNSPRGLVIDASNNLYIADTSNHKIRKITQE